MGACGAMVIVNRASKAGLAPCRPEHEGLQPRGLARTLPHGLRPVILESNNVAYRARTRAQVTKHGCRLSTNLTSPLRCCLPHASAGRKGRQRRADDAHASFCNTSHFTLPSCGRAFVRLTRFLR